MMVQMGRDALLAPARADRNAIAFDFSVRLAAAPAAAAPNFLGEFAQGPRGGRFVYVNSGARAGQTGTPWDRRAKISLESITSTQVKAVLAKPGLVLEARIAGTGRDGGPACATVPLLGAGWQVVAR
jgi:hypothetical protein